MLYPQLGSQYLSDPHQDVIARMEAFYAQSITINQQSWGEAKFGLVKSSLIDLEAYGESYGDRAQA